MKGSSNRVTAIRGSMDRGSTILELSRILALPLTPEVTPITMEAILTMEEATDKTVPTQQRPARKI